MIKVSITMVPGRTEDYVLNEGTTVKKALEIANLSGGEVRVNNEVHDLNAILDDGDVIHVFSKIKGALHDEDDDDDDDAEDAPTITVYVGIVPGKMHTITLNGDRTVRAAATAAELSISGLQIRVNEEEATLDSRIEDGDIVTFLKKVTGN